MQARGVVGVDARDILLRPRTRSCAKELTKTNGNDAAEAPA